MLFPIIFPQSFNPNPSSSECQTMLNYTNKLISSLENVAAKLQAVSTHPDEGLILIRNRVNTMLSEAKKLRRELNSIQSEATSKSNLTSNGYYQA